MNTKRRLLVTGIIGALLIAGMQGSVAPVAADDLQVGVIHDTRAGLNSDPLTDDRADRDATSVKAVVATSETTASVANTVVPVIAAPTTLPGVQSVRDDDRDLIQDDTQN